MSSFNQFSVKHLINNVKSADWAGANQNFAEAMQQKVADRLATERQTIFKEDAAPSKNRKRVTEEVSRQTMQAIESGRHAFSKKSEVELFKLLSSTADGGDQAEEAALVLGHHWHQEMAKAGTGAAGTLKAAAIVARILLTAKRAGVSTDELGKILQNFD